jgi:hypothetical protein
VTPLAPFASTKTLSFVDALPSTEMRLNVRRTAGTSSRCRSDAPIAASVVTWQIMVAMSGRIMPAPFAMAPRRTSPPASSTISSPVFG